MYMYYATWACPMEVFTGREEIADVQCLCMLRKIYRPVAVSSCAHFFSTLCLSLRTKHFKSSNHIAACVTFHQNSCSSQYKQAYFYNKAVKTHCILSVGTKVTNLKFSFKKKKKSTVITLVIECLKHTPKETS